MSGFVSGSKYKKYIFYELDMMNMFVFALSDVGLQVPQHHCVRERETEITGYELHVLDSESRVSECSSCEYALNMS